MFAEQWEGVPVEGVWFAKREEGGGGGGDEPNGGRDSLPNQSAFLERRECYKRHATSLDRQAAAHRTEAFYRGTSLDASGRSRATALCLISTFL